jgi:hypothetical protein
MNKWKEIFTNSPANNGYYSEKDLTERYWEWPRGTWLQSRLEHVRERKPAAVVTSFKQLGLWIELCNRRRIELNDASGKSRRIESSEKSVQLDA